MSEKKRKRREPNGDKTQKKVAATPEGIVKVEMLENKETLGPLLGMREVTWHLEDEERLTGMQLQHQDCISLRAYRSIPTSAPRSSQKAHPSCSFSNRQNTPASTTPHKKS
jgi:hypothetical protein